VHSPNVLLTSARALPNICTDTSLSGLCSRASLLGWLHSDVSLNERRKDGRKEGAKNTCVAAMGERSLASCIGELHSHMAGNSEAVVSRDGVIFFGCIC
jgi:hypothetical protein